MSRGMRVHEIFASQDLSESKKKKSTDHGLGLKKTFAPMPPGVGKKFGGYKPKILSDTSDATSFMNNGVSKPPAPISPSDDRPRPTLTQPKAFSPGPKSPPLTKPKPFIIGDKDTPMVLSSVGDNDDETENITSRLRDANIYDTVGNESDSDVEGHTVTNLNVFDDMYLAPKESTNLIETKNTSNINDTFATENPAFSMASEIPNTSKISHNKRNVNDVYPSKIPPAPPLPKTIISMNTTTTTTTNTEESSPHKDVLSSLPNQLQDDVYISQPQKQPSVFKLGDIQNGQTQSDIKDLTKDSEIQDVYTNGVHIPEPDYDEEEKTIDFGAEDSDDNLDDNPATPKNKIEDSQEPKQEQQQQQQQEPPKLRRLSRMYHGEDYSHYLSDEDEMKEHMSDIISVPSRKSKKQSQNGKINQRHSMFKPNSEESCDNNNKTLSSSKNKNKGSNKTKPKTTGVRNFSYADSKYGTKGRADGRNLELMIANNADDGVTFRDDSYESFLFSRHGHTMPSRVSVARNGDEFNVKKSGDDDKLWKKLTYRLRNKRNKNGYAMGET